MTWQINEGAIPTLAVGFTRATDALGNAIALSSGGVTAMCDVSFPSHAFFFTRDHRLFATEETARGLREQSLEEYRANDRRIVAVYYWTGWDDADRRNAGQEFLADIRADGGRRARYDFMGMFSFIPFIGKWFRQDPQKQICSENVASVHKKFGAKWINETLIRPDQLLKLMRESEECKCVLSYYL